MKKGLYWTGRALQVTALIALPAAIWAGEMARDEQTAIGIFVASIFIFMLGYLLTR